MASLRPRRALGSIAVLLLLSAAGGALAQDGGQEPLRIAASDADCPGDRELCLLVVQGDPRALEPGQEITVVYENRGSQAHTLHVARLSEHDPHRQTPGGHAFAATGNGSVLLPVETAGEHVILPNDTAYLQILDEEGEALGEPPGMQALGSKWTWSEAYELAPEGPDGTDLDVAQVPLAFGIQVRSSGDGPVPAYLSEGATVQLASPRGTVAETTVTCAPTCTFDGLFWWTTGPFATPDADTGTYELTASYDHAANIQVRAGQLHYER